MKKKKKQPFRIVVDSREQWPYRFKDSIVKGLEAGDYSIEGLEDRITVERKTKQDAYASLGRGRARFERELKRLSKYDYPVIVIESDLASFLEAPAFTMLNPRAAINSLISWSVKYGVHVFFASDRRYAKAITYRILEKFFKHSKETVSDKKHLCDG